MTRTLLALPLAVLSLVGAPSTSARAQDPKTAHGTVSALLADSVSVKVGAGEMKFHVDKTTQVQSPGAGTKMRRAAAAGKSGPSLAEVLRVGEAVEVSYANTNGALRASRIRVVASARPSGGFATSEQTSNGVVKSVGISLLTISGGGSGGATFTQTFTIDSTTKVIGKGVGTAAQNGKKQLTDLVMSGDHVSVSYRAAGDSLHASEIRLIGKGRGTR